MRFYRPARGERSSGGPPRGERRRSWRLVAAIRSLGTGLELMVVDDASPDGTGRIAEALAEGRGDMAVLHGAGTRGYGEALTDGFRAALVRALFDLPARDCTSGFRAYLAMR